MSERNVFHHDIRCCGVNGTAKMQVDGRVKVTGYDLAGEELSLICVEDQGVLLITVF
jgi:hypothetical protein